MEGFNKGDGFTRMRERAAEAAIVMEDTIVNCVNDL